MRHITIYECFDALQITKHPTHESITQEEADELNTYIIKEKLKQTNISWSRDSITFINYVGFIKLSTVSIEILPKIDINSNDYKGSRKSLINMLNKSGIINFNYSNIGMLNIYNMNLNEILSLIFARTLQRELVKGPYLEYINIEENTKALKGSMVVKDHIKNIANGISDVFCRFEEFSIDNRLNQIFSTCISKTIMNVRNSDTIKILNHLKVIFSDVSDIDISSNVLEYKFTRLNSRFEPSLLLAKMILSGYSSIGNKGEDKSFAILFEMNDVYEKYITNLLMLNLDDFMIHSQHSNHKLLRNEKTSKSIFTLKPDIVVEVDNKEKIIIDTKWKSIGEGLNRHGVKREDFYQMYAYLTKYEDANVAILLYPSNDKIKNFNNEFIESWYLDNDKSKKIRVYSIDLCNEEATVKNLKRIIKNNLI